MATGEKRPIFQAAAIPYRLHDGEPEFCLITAIRSGNWGIPKGLIDPGETAPQAALKEAWEEAGLHGHIEGEPLGHFQYRKWGATLEVAVYLMQVLQIDADWQEGSLRQRVWCRLREARKAVHRRELRDLLIVAAERIGR
jgi:8-oxo-dGTP pyrophosphatase MutT (NUDIX family)